MNFKRRGVFLLVLALSLAFMAPVGQAVEVRDVPAGHWAYEAVRALVEKGYLPLGEDQLFRGNEPTDRYTLATVVAKMIAEVESGRVSTTPDDVRTLRNLTDELRADLVKYYADLQRMEGQVAGAHQKLTAYDERLVQVISELGDLYRRAESIERTLEQSKIEGEAALSAESLLLKQRLGALTDSLEADLKSLRAEVDSVSEVLDVRSYEFNAADMELRQQVQALSQSLKTEADALRAQLDKERSDRIASIAELEDRVNVSFNQQGLQLAGQSTEVNHRLSEIVQEIAELERSLTENSAGTSERLVSVDQAFGQVREALNEQSEMLAAYEVALAQLTHDLASRTETLGRADGQLLASVEQLRQQLEEARGNNESVAARTAELENTLRSLETDLVSQVSAIESDNKELGGRLDDVRQELLIVQSQIGLSEEQVAELTRRVREEMAEQLTLSLVREGELQRTVTDLRKEFDSYRDTSQAELKSARSSQMMSIGALVLGVIAVLK